MDTCVLCFDIMDMLDFKDERDKTETCYKLECGHAFHTKCIIECLSKSDHKCPSCNKYKTPEQLLTKEGLVKKLVSEVKKDDNIKLLTTEFKEIRDELSSSIKQLKRDIKHYIKTRSEELKISRKREYMLKCLSEIRNKTISVAYKRGPQYIGAFNTERVYRYWRGTTFERAFFGKSITYSLYRLKYPRYYANLY